MKRVYVFWDNSNIFIGAQAARKRDRLPTYGVRVEFENLFKLALAGRRLARGYCVGSVPPEAWTVWQELARKTGIRPELFERGTGSGTEQAVDQALQVHMLRAMADEVEPQLAVLLTGDGKGYLDGVGFHADLERMHSRGWGIEVVSWRDTCAHRLREWAGEVGAFIALDDYLESVTYDQGLTGAKPLNMKRRPRA